MNIICHFHYQNIINTSIAANYVNWHYSSQSPVLHAGCCVVVAEKVNEGRCQLDTVICSQRCYSGTTLVLLWCYKVVLVEGTIQVLYTMMDYISQGGRVSASCFLIGFENNGSPKPPEADKSHL